MRVVRFDKDGTACVGVLSRDGQELIDVAAALGLSAAEVGTDATSLVGQGEAGLSLLSRALGEAERTGVGRSPLAGVTLLPPLVPPTILCAGQNYVDHVEEKPAMPFDWGGPANFLKLPQTVIASGAPIVYPHGLTTKLDYEGELAVVIGRAGRDISVDDALDHVYGYTVINDMALRDWQVRILADGSMVSLLGTSKNFDCGCPLGPALVTKDEIPDAHALRVQCLVNGITRQDNNTSNLVRGIPEIIEFFSLFLTLLPGTVIATGACGGTGWGMDPELAGAWPKPEGVDDPYLHPGDRIDCIVEGVGTLSNIVV
jgi:2-keto-4-pentenoate hydratase/2-oxohepta-3-ene-1,7-dioic acid hydratase in catechol pathway